MEALDSGPSQTFPNASLYLAGSDLYALQTVIVKYSAFLNFVSCSSELSNLWVLLSESSNL